MSKIVHLTDLHLTPLGRSLYGIDPNARLEAAIADINAYHRDASLVLVTGDLVHVGEPASYTVLRRALEKLKAPNRLLMGNHDDRASFRAAFPDHPADTAGVVQSVCETSAGPFVLIDTLDPGADGGPACVSHHASPWDSHPRQHRSPRAPGPLGSHRAIRHDPAHFSVGMCID